ncbi:T9SS type A sorting domain-containing protein [Flavobacterium sp. DGU11]|uniref:T9SS type A sorting domain-containing protein n=1 Tax=Flavobacterium arundinis TaxID=3139143 RepID=A0ABU9HRW5_9FLAO
MNQFYNSLWGVFTLNGKTREESSGRVYRRRPSYFAALAAVLMLFCVTGAFAQASDYTFTQTSGTFTPITGGTVVNTATGGTAMDSYSSPVQTMPTPFTFAGISYTTFYVTSNGQIQLGGASAPSTAEYRVISTSTGNNVFLAPFSGDLSVGPTGPGEIRWEQVGNEIVIQWKNFARYNKAETFNIQVRLNTVNGTIKFVYDGTPPYAATTDYQPQIGIKSSATNYLGLTVATAGSWNTPVEVRTGMTGTSIAAFNGAQGFTSGLTYNFTAPTCSAPSALTATLPTQNGITLGWTASVSSPASGYEYYISDTNTAPVAATAPTGTQATGTSVSAGSLNPSTIYYAWVRSACSGTDKSSWAGPVSFVTAQIPAPLPYTDGFEDANNWTLTNGTQANKWFVSNFVNNGGTKALYVSNSATGASNNYDNTTSVVHAYRDFSIPAGATIAQLDFDIKSGGESTYDYLRVWVVPTSYGPVAGTQTTVALGGAGTVMIADYQNLTNGAYLSKTFYVPVTPFAGQTARIIFEWVNDSGTRTQPAASIDNVVFKLPSCVPPASLVAAASPSGVALSWIAPATAPAGGYDIYYATTNTAPAPAAAASVNVPTGTTTTITTLNSDTVYYYWMRSVCSDSDKSGWVYGGSFMPDCAATTPTITQDFTSYTGAAPVPACWREAVGVLGTSVAVNNLTTGSAWTNENYNNFSGANGTAARVELYGTRNEWLISPGIDLGTTLDYQLEYAASVTQWSGSAAIDMGEKSVKVLISTDGGLTWAAANTLKTYNNTNAPIGGVNEVISLAAYTGVVKIAFYANSATTTQDLRFYIDNFRVRAIPQCFAPTNLATTTITKNTAGITWTASSPAPVNGYEYYVATTATAPTGATTASGSVAAGVVNASIPSLTPSTDYYVWVRANCNTDGQSEWIGPVSFKTLCDSYEITSTTPAARCGTGTVALNAVATGGVITWYDAAGAPLGTGSPFTTPSISATTTYYARAVQSTAGNGVIGTATTLTGDWDQPTAFNNRYASYKQQIIYTAQELLASGLTAGNITSMAFNIATLGSSANNTNFKVRIANTSLSSFANTTYATTGFSTVFGPVTYTHTASGWQTITFTTPYSWDGESNIIVEVSSQGIDSSNNSQTYYTSTTNPMVLSNISDLTATTGTASVQRLNTTFSGQVGCSSPKTAVVATVNTAPDFVISGNAVAICNGQTSSAITVTTGAADYDSYVWSPATGVSGNATSGWTFNPTATTTYTLTASQTTGAACTAVKTVVVTVNELPGAVTVTPPAGPVCTDSVVTLTASGGTTPGSVTIGTATTNTTNTEELTAFNNRRQNYKSQTIYTAAELHAAGLQAGNILSVTYNVFAVSATSVTNTNYTVKMGATTLTSFPNTTYLSEASFTTVYGPVTQTHTAGLNAITFTSPYPWDGVSNIVVSVSMAGVDGLYNAQTYYTDLGANTTLYNYDNLTATTGTTSTKRLNLGFGGFVGGPMTWTPATNLYTNAAATTAYVAGSDARTVYAKSSAVGTTTYTATATANSGCTATATVNVDVIDCGINWANLQWPASGTTTTCGDFTAYAQVYKAGVTEAPGANTSITAWIGFSATNTDPSTWAESDWHLATFNLQSGNNDEYMYTISGLPAGTYYYASRFRFLTGSNYYGGFSGGQWDGTTNVSGVLTVNGVAAPTATATLTLCNSGTVNDLQATGETGATIKWYAAATGGVALDNTTALTNGGTYYASQTVGGCEGTARTLVTVTLNTPAAPVAAASQTVCNSGTLASLNAVGGAGATISWYANATGGTALPLTTELTNGGVYYASATIAGCESTTRTMVTATVNTVAAPVAAASQTVCNSGTLASLNAVGGAGATISWYANATGGTALPLTTELTNGGVYYASATIAGCESTARTMVTATVNTVAAPVAAASQTVCGSGTLASLNAVGGAGATISWYADATGGTSLPLTTALTDGGVYYASATIAGCESAVRTMVTATVSVVAVPTFTLVQPTCTTATGTVTVTAPVGTEYTYSIDGTNFQASATFNGLAAGTYTVTAKNAADCTATSSVTINAAPDLPATPTVTLTQPTCTVATGTIEVTAPIADANTYSIDGTTFGPSSIFENVAPGTYTVTVKNSAGCTATASVTINAAPAGPDAPTGNATQEITVDNAADATIEDIVVTATGTVKWYANEEDALAGTDALAAGTQVEDGTTYYGTQTIGECESAPIAVTVDVLLGKTDFNMSALVYHPNPVKDVLNISYSSEISSVIVYDLLGQKVIAKQPGTNEVKLDMSGLADATYIVNITVGNTVKTIKVVKRQ